VRKPNPSESFFFVDESGDPVFYDTHGNRIAGTEGCSPVFILGYIETQDPWGMRRAILDLHHEVTTDSYLTKFPSMRKTNIAFHAKDDGPVVRYLFYKLIATLDFKAQFIVARKLEHIFRNNHGGKENKFYDNLVTKLFQNVLHRFEHNRIVFSKRGSRDRRKKLEHAIWRAKKRFEINHSLGIDCTRFTIMPETPLGEPCLSVIDYMNWAVHRAFVKGDMSQFEFVRPKVSYLRDIYDFTAQPYSRKNPFDIKKAAPLELGS
jgi:Protein of unknown function (DUF3800)